MNFGRLALATVASFVFVFLLDFVVHGVLLKDIYAMTPEVWRPMGDGSHMMYMWVSQLLFSFIVVTVFAKHCSEGGAKSGACWGLAVGAILASLALGSYCYLPISFDLTLAWMGTDLVRGLGVGTIAGLLYKK